MENSAIFHSTRGEGPAPPLQEISALRSLAGWGRRLDFTGLARPAASESKSKQGDPAVGISTAPGRDCSRMRESLRLKSGLISSAHRSWNASASMREFRRAFAVESMRALRRCSMAPMRASRRQRKPSTAMPVPNNRKDNLGGITHAGSLSHPGLGFLWLNNA